MLVLIGSSPSSGSTLLADLFDAVPGYVCGPESKLFCYEELYEDYPAYRKRIRNRFAFSTPSLQNFRGTFTRRKQVLDAYGLTADKIYHNADNVDSPINYINELKSCYLNARNLNEDHIWIEKYPENIFIAEAYLDKFRDGYFIQIVRDPKYVYQSLMKKSHFSPALAIGTWLIAVSKGYALRNHPRVITIKYEDLVEAPFDLIANMASRISGNEVDAQLIKENFKKNTYRSDSEVRASTWSVPNYGEVQNANAKPISNNTLKEYNQFGGITINKKYANLYKLPIVDIDEVCSHYGYDAPTDEFDNKIDVGTKKHLFTKFMLDYFFGKTPLKTLPYYLNPIKR